MKSEFKKGDKVKIVLRDGPEVAGIPYSGWTTTVREVHNKGKLATVAATNGYAYAVVFADEMVRI